MKKYIFRQKNKFGGVRSRIIECEEQPSKEFLAKFKATIEPYYGPRKGIPIAPSGNGIQDE